MATTLQPPPAITLPKHALAVRLSHWLVVLAVIALLVSGFNILTSHPRLYWGETGTIHDKPWLVLPLPSSRASVPTLYSFGLADRNGWSRYLHFEAAWVLLLTGLAYLTWGLFSGHFRRDLMPRSGERNTRAIAAVAAKYLRYFGARGPLAIDDEGGYNPLQRVTYIVIVFALFPAIIASGLAMSSYFAAAFPQLVDMFGGRQSARSCHFIFVSALVGFIGLHVVLVAVSGFTKLVRGMTIGMR